MSRNRKQKLYKDNRGSGLIMVLIMVAFLGILAGVLMFAAYSGYQMRLLDKQNTDNFYSVETVLDEINIGLQSEVSKALSKAYQDVMVNYSLYETPTARTQKLYEIYYKELQLALQLDSANPNVYNIDLLRGYLSDELYGDGADADGSREKFGTYGAIVESNLEPQAYALSLAANGIILKDLKVTYVNQRGFVSIISTDIRIALPQVDFSQSSAFPDLEQYCTIADKGIKAGNSFADGSIVFTGNMYAESMTLGSQMGTVDHDGAYNFGAGNEITFHAPVANPSTEVEALVVSKGDITLNQTTFSTSDIDLWSQDIVLSSAEAVLNGNTYVQNDLKLEGDGSKATLSGTYTGFGTSLDSSDGSSAIVINGRNSSLDLSAITNLNISGHTYIATSAEELVPGVHDDNDSQKDILMGESVAVKSNQLVYLVPPEALGCEILMDGVSIGESVYRSNPMKISQYEEIKNNPDKYVMIDATSQITALGGHTLSEYMEQQTLTDGTAAYRPIVIVKQNSAGQSLVYCYMQFKDEKAANRYFRDYYGVNEESVEKYTKIYADAIKMPEEESDLLYLHLAGNVLEYQGDEFSVMKATDSPGEKARAQELSLMREDMFKALTTKMVTNISQVSIAEQNKTVFKNMIDETTLSLLVGQLRESAIDDSVVIYTADNSKAVVLCTGDYTIDGTKVDEDKVKMVICLGDVRVKKDFEGLIMAGGEIVIGDENDLDHKVEITNLSLADYTELLQAKQTKDGSDYYVLDAFWEGENYWNSNTAGTIDSGTREVALEELIIYERWSKK